MLEQQPPVFANPWDNQSSFRFPPASSSMDPASTEYQHHQDQVHQHRTEKQQQNNHPVSSSYSSEYETLNEDNEQQTGDTPYWLGGPLTDEYSEPATSSGANNSSATTTATTSMTTNNNNGNSSMSFMSKDQDQYQKREGELLFEREQIFHPQMESTLPYRRHSLAHETLSQQRKSSFFATLSVPAEKRASFSAASPSSFIMGQQTPWMPNSLINNSQFATAEDTAVSSTEQQQRENRFGTNNIWSTTKLKSALPVTTANQQHQQQQSLLWEYSLVGNKVSSSTNNYTPSPTTSSSTSSQTLLPSSYAHSPRFTLGERDLQQQQPLRASRRLSLSPLPTTSEESVQEHFNPRDILSSVPEEPGFLPYRRHSLAGPLLGVATTRSNTTSADIDAVAAASYLNEQRQQQRELDKFLPSNLLSSDLFESVDYSSHQQHHNLSTTMSWCMVEFKAGRSEIYHSTIPVEKNDWIIVEADRGRDLGKVVAKDLPADQVALLLQSTNSGMWEDPAVQNGEGIIPSPPNNTSPAILMTSQSTGTSTSSSSSPTTLSTTTAPSLKRICRLATTAEITLLVTKRQDEQKALLICQTKSKQKKLMMDIVDAEYQWDRRKLTFYFVAERRVDFRELVRDLFKIYKTRIWMCSVNTMSKKQAM